MSVVEVRDGFVDRAAGQPPIARRLQALRRLEEHVSNQGVVLKRTSPGPFRATDGVVAVEGSRRAHCGGDEVERAHKLPLERVIRSVLQSGPARNGWAFTKLRSEIESRRSWFTHRAGPSSYLCADPDNERDQGLHTPAH